MGAKVGGTVFADTRSLYEALTSGITKCVLDFSGMHLEWNVLAIKVTASSTENATFTGVFIFDNGPAVVSVRVVNGEEHAGGQISIDVMPLAKATS